jgi:O-methyltransferase domain/Dimerisation domain
MNATSPEVQQLPPQAVLVQMATGYIISQAISVAARLGIADKLNESPKNIDQLAELTETHAPSLFRLMRALTSVGIFQQNEDGSYSNSPSSEFLRSDHPESLSNIIYMMGDKEHWHSHGNLLHSVKTGQTAFDHTFGMPFFPYIQQNPQVAEIFDNGMTSFSQGIARAIAGTYDFSGAETIADIGGGHGILLSTILRANPSAKGVLFDQPQVVAGSGDLLENAGVSDRVEVVGGNFFEEIPVAADVYLMKHIIHDWNDEESLSILSNLAKSVQAGAKLLLIESVIEAENVPSMSKVMDLNMLAMTSGRERTAAEYSDLFEKTGFQLTNIIPTPSPTQIVEAIKV